MLIKIMTAILMLLQCSSLAAGTLTSPAVNSGKAEVMVRVRLAEGLSRIEVSGLGLKSTSAKSGKEIFFSPLSGDKKIFRLSTAGNEKNKRNWSIGRKKSKDQQLLPDETLILRGDQLKINEWSSLPTTVWLQPREQNTFDLVIPLPIEEYLHVVLVSEMPASWPFEALKAQAIAARSFTMSLMNERQAWGYDIEAGVNDQVYNLNKWELANPEARKIISQALEQTRGEVLAFGKNQIFRAYYHSDSGGQTETASNVWGESAQPSTSVESYEPEKSPYKKWEFSLAKTSLENRLRKYFSLNEKVTGFVIEEKTASSRVKNLKVIFEKTSRYLAANDLRRLLGFNNLKSTLFSLKEIAGSYTFNGTGFGHGVGLSQWGCKGLAEKGYGHLMILAHYFPETRVVDVKLLHN